MPKEERNSNIIIAFLVLAVIISGTFAYYSVMNLKPRISGNVVDNQGYANLTVETSTQINFTNRDISWGSGRVTTGQLSAAIDTFGNVARGNWTPVTAGLVLVNIGNTNLSIDIAAGVDNVSLLGGTNPGYDWYFSNNLTNSCFNSTNLNVFYHANTSTRVCQRLGFITTANALEIDFNLTIPYNAIVGRRTDTITATATAV